MIYKEQIKKISDVLDRLIEILYFAGDNGWMRALKGNRYRCEFVKTNEDAKILSKSILSIYGGFGSFNDNACIGGYVDEKGAFATHKNQDEYVKLQGELYKLASDLYIKITEG